MRSEGDRSVKPLLYALKNGAFSWVSASGFHISVAGLLGVAGFVLALKKDCKFGNLSRLSWLSEGERRLEKLSLVPGLQNLGNNCFLNVILQALASCTYFQLFLQRLMEECDEKDENLPLAVALAALLEGNMKSYESLHSINSVTACFVPRLATLLEETMISHGEIAVTETTIDLAAVHEALRTPELCLAAEGRVVLSPRKVMLALELYIQNFNLTSQQDAAEAFLHLISSLREEFLDCYSPNQSSLVDAFDTANCRILSPNRTEDHCDQERWQKHLFGPFDGILGSILTCQSCSSQISLDYQFFHSLPLSPVLDSGSTIMAGCSLEDCLKQFVVAEHIENYHCSHCWHIAAIKYLSRMGENQMEIEKLRRCSAEDSCNCRSLLHLQKLPWSNNFSHTLKQLSISRCPKILCVQLQRASINEFGELVKLQGHIAFPLILDLSPFVKSGVGIKDLGASWQRGAKLQHHKPSSCTNRFNMKYDGKKLNSMYRLMGEDIYTKVLAADEHGCTAHQKPLHRESEFHFNEHALQRESKLPHIAENSDTLCTDTHMQSGDEVRELSQLCLSDTYMYCLASVVEHFGRVGSGHYTVYRSVRAESLKEDPDEQFETAVSRWFCISDSEVYSVSEKDVLAAEASLLFYERIIVS